MKLVLSHPGVGEITVPVDERGIIVGRQGGSPDLEMNWDGRVSRRHVRFWVEGDRVFYEDLNSRNGTWLGTEQKLGPHALEPGTQIIAGETTFALLVEPLPFEGVPSVVIEEILDEALSSALESFAPSDSLEPARPTGEMNVRELAAAIEEKKQAERARGPVPVFVSKDRVLVQAETREDLNTVWKAQLSTGGLFVPTETPPRNHAALEVLIKTPDGALLLHAEVVHVFDGGAAGPGSGSSHPAGVGLHVLDLTAENRAAIHRYASGHTDRLEARAPAQTAGSTPIDGALTRARDFIGRIEANDLYGAIGVESSAGVEAIATRLEELRQMFGRARKDANPPQMARLDAAIKLLERASALLGDKARRLDYDLRRGELRLKARLEAARDRTGPSIAELREAWGRVHPEKLEAAATLARKAMAARKNRDLVSAIEAGKQSLELDPFHDELRHTLKAWEGMIGSPRKPNS